MNTTLGNIKAAITNTYRRISPGHAGRYLAQLRASRNVLITRGPLDDEADNP